MSREGSEPPNNVNSLFVIEWKKSIVCVKPTFLICLSFPGYLKTYLKSSKSALYKQTSKLPPNRSAFSCIGLRAAILPSHTSQPCTSVMQNRYMHLPHNHTRASYPHHPQPCPARDCSTHGSRRTQPPQALLYTERVHRDRRDPPAPHTALQPCTPARRQCPAAGVGQGTLAAGTRGTAAQQGTPAAGTRGAGTHGRYRGLGTHQGVPRGCCLLSPDVWPVAGARGLCPVRDARREAVPGKPRRAAGARRIGCAAAAGDAQEGRLLVLAHGLAGAELRAGAGRVEAVPAAVGQGGGGGVEGTLGVGEGQQRP